jgi:hypothetical protein
MWLGVNTLELQSTVWSQMMVSFNSSSLTSQPTFPTSEGISSIIVVFMKNIDFQSSYDLSYYNIEYLYLVMKYNEKFKLF